MPERESPTQADVRMRGFARRATVEDALRWLDRQLAPMATEIVPLADAFRRIVAQDITCDVDVPTFERAMMDGYAVRGDDIQGASSYNPLPLRILGEALPGRAFEGRVETGTAVRIMTGAPLPAGADTVVPVEKVQTKTEQILVQADVPPGKHVGHAGEDVQRGATLLTAGRRLRPQDLGLLSSVGIANVPVVRAPRVRLVITGNELLPAGSRPTDYKITDANGPMLRALVQRDGGDPIHPGIVADQPQHIMQALCDDADIVIASGGSSVGQEDYVPNLIAEHGELAFHGIAMRPSSPTGMGKLNGRLVLLLPGNPVSCLCTYDFFAGRAIRGLAGLNVNWPYRQVTATIRRKVVSLVGRVDYARVAVKDGGVEPLAISGASILSSTTRANGFVIVPADCEGYPIGHEVNVFLYD